MQLKQKLNNIILEQGNKKLSTLLTLTTFKKRYLIEYDEIIEYRDRHDLNGFKFSELVYCILNDMTEKPKCYCGAVIDKYISFSLGYNRYCSAKCKNNDKKLISIRSEKYKQTCLEKYGVDNISKLDNIKQQKEQTSLKNYGVKYNTQRPEIKQLLSDSIKSELHQSAIKKGIYDKYGFNSPAKSDEVRQKLIDFNYNKRVKDLTELGKKNNYRFKSVNNYLIEANCNDCKRDFEIQYQLLKLRDKNKEVVCTKCNKLYGFSSKGETEVYNFIEQNYSGEIISRDRKVLGGNELDIYIPELKLAFEFNGVYWHNELNKSPLDHKNLSHRCKDVGIQLIHIWQDDWQYKKEIIKSMILNKLGKSKKIYARNCELRIVSSKEKSYFLNTNHLQGDTICKVNLGLYYKDELVSLMTFGKRTINKESKLELLRFCNKLGYTVVGGANKIFKSFVNNYMQIGEQIKSYADFSISHGNLYKHLGFDFIKHTEPNYWWIVSGIKSHRYNWRLDQLKKMNMWINGETEADTMHRHKYFRIFDSGSMLFRFIKT